MATLDDLYATNDPRRLFVLATTAINMHQENIDEIAAIRSGAVAALYAQGYSYKELAGLLGMSAPRVGQIVAANDEGVIEFLRAWSELERRLEEVAGFAASADVSDGQCAVSDYETALRVLSRSNTIEHEVLRDLDQVREIRNVVVHGRAELSLASAEEAIDKIVYLNAALTVWIKNARTQTASAVGKTQSRGAITGGLRMSSVTQIEQKLAQLSKDEATQRRRLSDATASAAKARTTASAKRSQASKTKSESMARSYTRSAEAAEKKASDEDKKAAEVSKRIGDLGKRKADLMKQLERANQTAIKARESEDRKRRSDERRHAEQIAHTASSIVRYVHEVRVIDPPRPEPLRVLYLTSNPDSNAYLRVDVEVREVRQAVRKADLRDLVQFEHRPAATPEDLLDGLNETRPHVIHFAGHGGGHSLLFDDGKIEGSTGRVVSFDLLARALSATSTPPKVLILNACDTLDGAEVLLESVPIVVAMASSVTDLAATAFAARFYSAVASAQPVSTAVDQGSVAVDLLDLSEGWKPSLLFRDEVDPSQIQLITGSLAD